MKTATNPQTGETVVLVNGQWVPADKTATNPETGESAFFVNGRWETSGKKEEPLLSPGLNPNDPRSYIVQALMNAPGDVAEAARGAWEAVKDPVGTVTGLGQLGGALLEKGGRKFEEFATGEEIPPTPGKEEAAEPLIEGIQSVIDDPLGTVVRHPVDTLMVMSGLGGPMKALDPLTTAGRAAGKAAGRTAENIYARGAGIPKNLLDERQKIARGGLDEGLDVSVAGAKKANATQEALNQRLNTIVSDAAERMVLVPRTTVTKYLDDLIESRKGKFEADLDIAKLQKIKDQFNAQFGTQRMLDPQELHKFKTDIYTKAYQRSADPAKAAGRAALKTDAMRQMGRGAKEGIESRLDEYGPLNKRWSDVAQAKQYIDRRLRSAGELSVKGGPVEKLMQATLTNPTAWTKVAQAVDWLDRTGDVSKVEKMLNSRQTRLALYLAGMNENLNEE
jgi:hypothetical protein